MSLKCLEPHKSVLCFSLSPHTKYCMSSVSDLHLACILCCCLILKSSKGLHSTALSPVSLLCAYPIETFVKTIKNISRSHIYRQDPPVVSVVGNLTSEKTKLFFFASEVFCIIDGQKLWNKTSIKGEPGVLCPNLRINLITKRLPKLK